MTKVAAVQFRPAKGEWGGIHREARRADCTRGPASGAQLIVCPEMAVTGYLFHSRSAALKVAEPMLGPTYQRLSALARKHGIYLVAGYPEVAPPAPEEPQAGSAPAEAERAFSLYNSAIVIGPTGACPTTTASACSSIRPPLWAAPGDAPTPARDPPRHA